MVKRIILFDVFQVQVIEEEKVLNIFTFCCTMGYYTLKFACPMNRVIDSFSVE
jgi:hypothetical protein